MATPIVYLPALVRVEGNKTNDKPDFKLWLASTVALGALAYYAPKTFLAACAGMFVFQVYHFNKLVQSADSTPQQIHTWTLKACIVMSAVATVFVLKSVPCVLSALSDVRHLHILRAIGYLVKASVFFGIGRYLSHFIDSAKTLASQRSWVAMEDYVKNYPQDVKQNALSTYPKQLAFYISAVIPQTLIAAFLSRNDFARVQFSSDQTKSSFVERHIQSDSLDNWNIVIHQLQQLPAETQLLHAPHLALKAEKQFDAAAQKAFPNEVKTLLIGARLKTFVGIPSRHEASCAEWQNLMHEFDQLGQDAQEILGAECLRLLGDNLAHTEKTSSEFRLAALKVIPLLVYKRNISAPLEIKEKNTQTDALFDSLLPEHRTNLGAFLKKAYQDSKIYVDRLSDKLKASIPIV